MQDWLWYTKKMSTSDESLQFQLNDFLGKSYMLYDSKNYDEFLREIGVMRNTRIQAINSEPTVLLSLVDDEYLLCTKYPEGRVVKVRFTVGKEMQRRRPAAGPTSSVFQVVDNNLIETQIVDDKKVVVVRKFEEKELLVTMEVNDVKCYRWYKILPSDSIPSFATETSRRVPLERIKTRSVSKRETVHILKEDMTRKNSEISEDNCY